MSTSNNTREMPTNSASSSTARNDGALSSTQLPGSRLAQRPVASNATRGALRRAGRKSLFNPNMNNVEITCEGGKMLSDAELDTIDAHLEKYDKNEYYVNLLYYLISTDASNKVNPDDTVTLSVAGGEHTSFSWEKIFGELKTVLPGERFTIRRYARALAPGLLDIWMNADRFIEMRKDENNPLNATGIRGIAAIYTCSFMEHLIPNDMRNTIAMYNSSRTITNKPDYIGDIDAFATRTVNARSNVNDTDVDQIIG